MFIKSKYLEYNNLKNHVTETNDRIGKILLRDLKIGDEIYSEYETERIVLRESNEEIKEEISDEYLKNIPKISELKI